MTDERDNDEIPTAEAAAILGLSVPVLVRKMEMGELPFRLVPEDRWVRKQDVLALKKRLERNRQAIWTLAPDSDELARIIESMHPVRGIGSIQTERGYQDPAMRKEAFLLVARIRLAGEAGGLDAKAVATTVNNSGIVGFFDEEQILQILRGQIRKFPLSTLRGIVKILEMYTERPTT